MNIALRSRRDSLFLILVLISGTALRLTRLGYQSEWNDEALSVVIAKGSLYQILTNQFQTRHPPGYYLLLHFWLNLFGDSDFALRLLSAIAGILSIYVIYLLGETLFSHKTGLWAAAITASMPYHLYYSQEIRAYSLLFFLTVAMMLGEAKIWKETSSRFSARFWWGIYIVAAVMGLSMHYLYPLAVGAMGLYFIIHRWAASKGPDWRTFFIVHGIIGVLYLPIFIAAIQEAGGPAYFAEKTSLGAFLSVPLALTVGQFLPGTLVMAAYGLILILIIISMLQVGRAFYQKAQERSGLGLIILAYWLPILTLFSVALVWQSLTSSRLLILAAPGIYLLLAWSMTLTKEKTFNLVLVVLLLGFGLWADYDWLFVAGHQKPPAREAAHHLQEVAAANEPIYYANDSGFRLFHRYAPELDHHLYLNTASPYANPKVIPEVIELTGGSITTPDEQLNGRFWLVLLYDFDFELQNEILAEFESRYDRIASEDVGGIVMYQYEAGN